MTFAHHKGGTGKTTACINVAGAAARTGARVLVVDMDPQANATAGLGIDVSSVSRSLADVLAGAAPLSDVILETDSRIHVAPATLDLAGAEPYLYQLASGRLERLRTVLRPVAARYDHVLVDSPPGAGVLALNCLAAAERVVVPLDAGVFALEDLSALTTLLEEVARATGRRPLSDVAVVSRADRPRILDVLLGRPDPVREVVEELTRRFRAVHVVPTDRAVFESHRRGLPLLEVAPRSPAGLAYETVAEDVLDHGGDRA
ncbi:MAG TPA: AAA family ATPase [Candidatus Thermoplasmatota archaeon]|nr:AAA family ATPase [Candidatus Thermoplasmatota archaeon]